jgi:tetratricopeptide (TPR) repeat protein
VSANATSVSASAAAAPSATISVAAWNPKVPYLKSLRSVPLEKAYERYLNLKVKYAEQPSFYIDVCDFFIQKKEPKIAVRVLSNLAEMQLKDPALLRVLAQKLVQLKSYKMAIGILKSVIDLRPEEPQSYRDYGLALAQMGKHNEAVRQLYKVVQKSYDGRFEGIHLIALNEINHLIAQHPKEIDTKGIPEYFLVQLPMDIRIVLNWDADNTDVDLWVTEPNQEKCMYSYKLTSNGGRISNDFTQGYGPEEYLIRNAPKGTYRIQAHYYGNHRPTLSGKAILTVQFYQYYGTPYEVKREVTRRLSVVDEELDLATFDFN